MNDSIDLNRLRSTVQRNQQRQQTDPDAPQHTIVVDREGRMRFGDEVTPEERRELATVKQDTFHAESAAARAAVQLELAAPEAAEALGAEDWKVFPRRWQDVDLLAADFDLPGGAKLLVLAGEGFPGLPPLAFFETGGQTTPLDLRWDLGEPCERRLAAALLGHFVPPGPYRPLYGPDREHLLSADPAAARAAGWKRFFSGAAPQDREISRALFARSGGLIGRDLAKKRVFVAGLGSGGSYIAEQLVRAGVGSLVLVDPDEVEAANLSRTGYETADIGRPKTEALARRLLRIRPDLSLETDPRPLGADGPEALAAAFSRTDLVLALTDDPSAQSLLNHAVWHSGTPAVFASLYKKAEGGEVVLCVPGRTPCYRCSTGGVREQLGTAETERDLDYGTGRLAAETALAADIQHLDTATVKLALSLLAKDVPGSSLARFAENALQRRFTYLVMSMAPDYWFFPSLFGDTPGQYAYQAAWITPEPDPACPVCGAQEHRAPLAQTAAATPALDQFESI
jgi:molybdopterin/thiamine biosynthesis adenylyltransferase